MNNNYFEAVEICPHCDSENIYPMWNTEIDGFVAVCKYCGKEIFLCDECQHTILQDGEVHDCDWCKTEYGGKCHRGTTKNKNINFIMNEKLVVYRVGFNGNDETEVDAMCEDEAVELAKSIAMESNLDFELDYVECIGYANN